MTHADINKALHAINDARKAEDFLGLCAAAQRFEMGATLSARDSAEEQIWKALAKIARSHAKLLRGWPTEAGTKRRTTEVKAAIKSAGHALKVNAAAL